MDSLRNIWLRKTTFCLIKKIQNIKLWAFENSSSRNIPPLTFATTSFSCPEVKEKKRKNPSWQPITNFWGSHFNIIKFQSGTLDLNWNENWIPPPSPPPPPVPGMNYCPHLSHGPLHTHRRFYPRWRKYRLSPFSSGLNPLSYSLLRTNRQQPFYKYNPCPY